MIQRIQTIFLVLAVISGALLFYFPLAEYYHELYGNYKFFVTELKSMDPDPKITTSIWFTSPLWLIAGASIILTLISIFLYKNRLTQLRLVAFNILLNIGLVVLVFIIYSSKITELTQIEPAYQIGIFLPLISLVFLILANRFIRKDEALVKAADRLR
ncbi:MAG: DUF4293 domain-containing protein [Bacteroidales bacterium]|nr:DUF4293 domain-containing protein [Deltaproteobacteria bacterium]MBL7137364.1 DUF4293 domain-containing protein [Bacteroidales bacterium]